MNDQQESRSLSNREPPAEREGEYLRCLSSVI